MRTFHAALPRPFLAAFCVLFSLALASTAHAVTDLTRLAPSAPPAPVATAPEAPDVDHPEESDGPASLQELQARLNDADRTTALNALTIALDEVGDGSTFVWTKNHRHLKGIIKPTSAFRDADGRVCRHVIYALKLAEYVKQIETIACRQPDGRWSL